MCDRMQHLPFLITYLSTILTTILSQAEKKLAHQNKIGRLNVSLMIFMYFDKKHTQFLSQTILFTHCTFTSRSKYQRIRESFATNS